MKNNSVTNVIWSPCVSVPECAASATGILVYQSDDVTIQGNSVSDTQGGIAVFQGNNVRAKGNIIFDTLVFDGIGFVGDGNQAEGNFIVHSDESGVFVQGNNNVVTDNRINEAPIGVLKISGSTGTTISGNHFFNTPITVQDPPQSASAKARQPYR